MSYTRIIHYRLLQGEHRSPISMREFRHLRDVEIPNQNESLRNAGFSHIEFATPELSPYGGYTVAVDDNGNVGVAKCNLGGQVAIADDGHPLVDENGNFQRVAPDRFVRRTGVQLALQNLRQVQNGEVDQLAFVRNDADRRLLHSLQESGLLQVVDA